MSKIILEELSNLTVELVVNHASEEISNKLLKGFSQDQLEGLSEFEIERMIDELITPALLDSMGLNQDQSDKILLGTLAKIQS